MKKRLLGLLLSAMMVLSCTILATASGGDTKDQSVQENAVAAYDEMLDSFGRTYSDTEEIVYPDSYGGAYINESGKLVVYLTDDSARPAALSGYDDVIYQLCDYSYNDLLSVMDELNQYKFSRANEEVSQNFNEFALYDSENRVVVKLDDFSDESIQEFRENVCDSDAIVFEQGYGPVDTEVNVNAGSEISFSGGRASLGYRVKRNGVVGFVTAGHAADSVGKVIRYNGTAFASCRATRQGGSADAAFCAITNSNYSPTNTLFGTSNVLSTTISRPGVGTIINKIGMATGHTSGRVQSTNATATFTSGATITNLTTADYRSAPGDSGCVVYSYIGSTNARLTLGIHTGASRNGVTRYYTKADEVNAALGTYRY